MGGADPGSPPAPPSGFRRFRSPWGRWRNQDALPRLYITGKSLFLSPHCPGRRLFPSLGPGWCVAR